MNSDFDILGIWGIWAVLAFHLSLSFYFAGEFCLVVIPFFLGHPQPKTWMQVDNSTAGGVANSNIQPKRTKAMDMRLRWLRDRAAQRQFRFYWRPGKTNLANYWTKHHCPAHHQEMRHKFLTPKKILWALQASLQRTPALF